MAKVYRLRSRKPSVARPNYSFTSIVVATGAFLFMCFGIPMIAFMNKEAKSSLSLSNSKVLFERPSDVPDKIVSNLDAILVLGGGRPLSVDEPPVFVQRRCDDAAEIVERRRILENQTKVRQSNRKTGTATTLLPILCLSAGTAHLPQLMSPNGLPVWESTSSAAYLLKKHSLSNNVFVETTSYDTIGNAFFARTGFTDINDWKNLLIITNEFHMNRTQEIFDWIFGVDLLNTEKYNLAYLSSPDIGLSEEAIAARRAREEQSLITVRDRLAPKYQSMKAVWSFLNHDHALYTAEKLVQRGSAENASNKADVALKQSYGEVSH